jgi:hypothetical protein
VKARVAIVAVTLAVLAATIPGPAAAGPLGLSIGAYGGVNFSPIDNPDAGALLGAKVRLTPPLGFLAVEAYYSRISNEDAEDAWNHGDVDVVMNGDGFDLYGADVLLGSPGGPGPLRWFLVAGINVKELSDLDGEGTFRPGADVGTGVELAIPVTGLSVEARAALVWLDWSAPGDLEFLSVTAGLNYSF